MKKIGLVGIVASALSAVVIGIAGPAQADDGDGFGGRDGGRGSSLDRGHRRDRDHRNNPWIDQLFPTVKVPHVDTTVRN